jgi:hypothetical protein
MAEINFIFFQDSQIVKMGKFKIAPLQKKYLIINYI